MGTVDVYLVVAQACTRRRRQERDARRSASCLTEAREFATVASQCPATVRPQHRPDAVEPCGESLRGDGLRLAFRRGEVFLGGCRRDDEVKVARSRLHPEADILDQFGAAHRLVRNDQIAGHRIPLALTPGFPVVT